MASFKSVLFHVSFIIFMVIVNTVWIRKEKSVLNNIELIVKVFEVNPETSFPEKGIWNANQGRSRSDQNKTLNKQSKDFSCRTMGNKSPSNFFFKNIFMVTSRAEVYHKGLTYWKYILTLIACNFQRFHWLVILNSYKNFSFNRMTAVSVEMLEIWRR